MAVKHVLKDGTVLDDIAGHVVRMQDAQGVYTLIDGINMSKKRSSHEKGVSDG